MLYERIGRHIRALRIRQQLTQQQLASAANISLSFLGHIERGSRKLSVDTLYNIATVLKCSVDELMETGMYHTGPMTVQDLLAQAIDLLDDGAAHT
jgi:transcriptional regulator with XRE-family HTH domain